MKKLLSFVLLGAVLFVMPLSPLAQGMQTEKARQQTANVKAAVESIGVGARISIRFHDKREVTGYTSQLGTDDFILTKAKAGTKQTIAYADVARIEPKNEKRISTAGKILIVFGILALMGAIGNGTG